MALTVPPPTTNLLELPPGFTRAYGRAVVFGYLNGATAPLPGVLVRAYVPGTDTPWPDPLYLDESATIPAVFPVATNASGAVELWAPAPGRAELMCTSVGWVGQRVVLDLEPTPEGAAPGPVAGVDSELRAYVQRIMAVLDPGGPPPPAP